MDLSPRKGGARRATRNLRGRPRVSLIRSPRRTPSMKLDDIFSDYDRGRGAPLCIHAAVDDNDGSDTTRFSDVDDADSDAARKREREQRRRADGKERRRRQQTMDELAEAQRRGETRRDRAAESVDMVNDDDESVASSFDGIRIDRIRDPAKRTYVDGVMQQLGYGRDGAGGRSEKKAYRRGAQRGRSSERVLASYAEDPLELACEILGSARPSPTTAAHPRGNPPEEGRSRARAGSKRQGRGTPQTVTQAIGDAVKIGGRGSISVRRGKRAAASCQEEPTAAVLLQETARDGSKGPSSGEKRGPAQEDDAGSRRKKHAGPKGAPRDAGRIAPDRSGESPPQPKGDDDGAQLVEAIRESLQPVGQEECEHRETPTPRGRESLWDSEKAKSALKGLQPFGLRAAGAGSVRNPRDAIDLDGDLIASDSSARSGESPPQPKGDGDGAQLVEAIQESLQPVGQEEYEHGETPTPRGESLWDAEKAKAALKGLQPFGLRTAGAGRVRNSRRNQGKKSIAEHLTPSAKDDIVPSPVAALGLSVKKGALGGGDGLRRMPRKKGLDQEDHEHGETPTPRVESLWDGENAKTALKGLQPFGLRTAGASSVRNSRRNQGTKSNAEHLTPTVKDDIAPSPVATLGLSVKKGALAGDDGLRRMPQKKDLDQEEYEHWETPTPRVEPLWDETALKGLQPFGLRPAGASRVRNSRRNQGTKSIAEHPTQTVKDDIVPSPVASLGLSVKKGALGGGDGLMPRKKGWADRATKDASADRGWLERRARSQRAVARGGGKDERTSHVQKNCTEAKLKNHSGLFDKRCTVSLSKKQGGKQKSGNSSRLRSDNTGRRETQSSPRMRSGSGSDEDDCSSVSDEHAEKNVAGGPSTRKRTLGDRASIDALRIAVGKTVFSKKCELSFQFGVHDPYLQFSYFHRDKQMQHPVYLKSDDLKEVKYFVAGDDDAFADDSFEPISVIVFRITPTTKNNFAKYFNAYSQENTEDEENMHGHYISVEVRDAEDLQRMLHLMREHDILEDSCNKGAEITLRDLANYAIALQEESRKERESLDSPGGPSSGVKRGPARDGDKKRAGQTDAVLNASDLMELHNSAQPTKSPPPCGRGDDCTELHAAVEESSRPVDRDIRDRGATPTPHEMALGDGDGAKMAMKVVQPFGLRPAGAHSIRNSCRDQKNFVDHPRLKAKDRSISSSDVAIQAKVNTPSKTTAKERQANPKNEKHNRKEQAITALASIETLAQATQYTESGKSRENVNMEHDEDIVLLEGTLSCSHRFNERRHTIRGNWKYEKHKNWPTQGFILMRTIAPGQNLEELPKDGEFSGSFRNCKFKNSKGEIVTRQGGDVKETGVKLTFAPRDGEESGAFFDVKGSGINDYGDFELFGSATKNAWGRNPTYSLSIRKKYISSLPPVSPIQVARTLAVAATAPEGGKKDNKRKLTNDAGTSNNMGVPATELTPQGTQPCGNSICTVLPMKQAASRKMVIKKTVIDRTDLAGKPQEPFTPFAPSLLQRKSGLVQRTHTRFKEEAPQSQTDQLPQADSLQQSTEGQDLPLVLQDAEQVVMSEEDRKAWAITQQEKNARGFSIEQDASKMVVPAPKENQEEASYCQDASNNSVAIEEDEDLKHAYFCIVNSGKVINKYVRVPCRKTISFKQLRDMINEQVTLSLKSFEFVAFGGKIPMDPKQEKVFNIWKSDFTERRDGVGYTLYHVFIKEVKAITAASGKGGAVLVKSTAGAAVGKGQNSDMDIALSEEQQIISKSAALPSTLQERDENEYVISPTL